MSNPEKPEAHGPSPSAKAHDALGEKLNRPPKPPPTFPGGEIEKNEPPARRTNEEVNDL